MEIISDRQEQNVHNRFLLKFVHCGESVADDSVTMRKILGRHRHGRVCVWNCVRTCDRDDLPRCSRPYRFLPFINEEPSQFSYCTFSVSIQAGIQMGIVLSLEAADYDGNLLEIFVPFIFNAC